MDRKRPDVKLYRYGGVAVKVIDGTRIVVLRTPAGLLARAARNGRHALAHLAPLPKGYRKLIAEETERSGIVLPPGAKA